MLFGMTEMGGNGDGCIFSIDTDGNGYKILLDFNGANGALPLGGLTLSESQLYGMTNVGGINGYGVIFSIDTAGGNYKDLHDFNDTNGAEPDGDLILLGGRLYGMTGLGGPNDSGCIFAIDTNGKNYKDLFDFNGSNGRTPYGSLLLSGNKFYGMTSESQHGYGTIFSIDTNGNSFKNLHDFNDTNGAWPFGSLILSGKMLYGMTENGFSPISIWGTIFSMDTDGTRFTDLHNFNYTNGLDPYGDLILSRGTLYGMTSGGSMTFGNVFSIDTDGSRFHDLIDFNGAPGGSEPYGSLIIAGSNLYGMTYRGGINNDGSIFKIHSDSNLSVNNLKSISASINLYPNPNNGQFTLQSSVVGNQLSVVEVYNVLGEKVLTEIRLLADNSIINLSGQPSGVYFYRVLQKDGELIGEGKFVIAP